MGVVGALKLHYSEAADISMFFSFGSRQISHDEEEARKRNSPDHPGNFPME